MPDSFPCHDEQARMQQQATSARYAATIRVVGPPPNSRLGPARLDRHSGPEASAASSR